MPADLEPGEGLAYEKVLRRGGEGMLREWNKAQEGTV